VEPRKRTRAIVLALLLAAGCALADAAAQHDPRTDHGRAWQDIESRIQYGYFTENSRALIDLRESLTTADAQDKLRSYYAALLAYRLTQLSMHPASGGARPPAPDKSRARELLEGCVASLDHALQIDSDFAEALALKSACLGMASELEPWRLPFTGLRGGTQIKKALQLAPDNPRVLLLQAIVDYDRGDTGEKPLGELKKAIAAFEAERRDIEHVPGWGAADAYLLLARVYLKRGDAVAARDALERSLLLAPDFVQARRLLLSITS
jgi:hypothetical protein